MKRMIIMLVVMILVAGFVSAQSETKTTSSATSSTQVNKATSGASSGKLAKTETTQNQNVKSEDKTEQAKETDKQTKEETKESNQKSTEKSKDSENSKTDDSKEEDKTEQAKETDKQTKEETGETDKKDVKKSQDSKQDETSDINKTKKGSDDAKIESKINENQTKISTDTSGNKTQQKKSYNESTNGSRNNLKKDYTEQVNESLNRTKKEDKTHENSDDSGSEGKKKDVRVIPTETHENAKNYVNGSQDVKLKESSSKDSDSIFSLIFSKISEIFDKLKAITLKTDAQDEKIKSLEAIVQKNQEELKFLKLRLSADGNNISVNNDSLDQSLLEKKYNKSLTGISASLSMPPRKIIEDQDNFPIDLIVTNTGKDEIKNLKVSIDSYPAIFIKNNKDVEIPSIGPGKTVIIRKTGEFTTKKDEKNNFDIMILSNYSKKVSKQVMD